MGRIRARYGASRTVRHVQRKTRRNRTCGNVVLTVRAELAAGANSLDLIEVEAGLRISWIQFLRCKEPMPLAAYVCELKHQIFRYFTLDSQVVLLRILRADVRRCLTV